MRLIGLVSFVVVLSMVPAVGGTIHCTEFGTNGSDQIVGTDHRDTICAHRGDDYAIGRGGPDIVRGGKGVDTLVGSDGADTLRGRGGNDSLFGTDGSTNDVIIGGTGFDKCYGDVGDVFISCEHVVQI
jgi:Ca2+-binding RTX toxin-like protein